MSLIKVLSRLTAYSPIVAKQYGVEVASAFNYIIQHNLFDSFTKNDIADLENDIGITNKNIIDQLLKSKLLLKVEDKYKVNKSHDLLQDEEMDEFEQAMLSAVHKINYTIYEDDEFENLLKKWNSEIVKLKYGREFSKSELQLKFQDAETFEVAMESLKVSYNNKFVTVNFAHGRNAIERARNVQASSGFKKGTWTGSNTRGNGGGNNNTSSKNKPSSSFSERTISAEE